MSQNNTHDVVLKVEHLTKLYPIKTSMFARAQAAVHAVEDVSFEVHKGETFAIVGESGCGKSTTGKCIVRLSNPTSGTIELDGEDFTAAEGKDLKRLRQKMQLIFQDPYASLNPRMTVRDIIAEPLDINRPELSAAEREAHIDKIMQAVGLDLAHKSRYPHEFSGGQRQRIGIARALMLEPELIVCDEPVSALDVSVQAKVINLLEELQERLGLAYIFISHDLSVVKHIADTVMVMYLGHTMELASKEELFAHPLHPYTQALMDVVPRIGLGRIADKRILEGDVPSPVHPPQGCVFHTRCPRAMKACATQIPESHEVSAGHFCACHLFNDELSEAERASL